MSENTINLYGDQLIENAGRGSDIASQRIDELDKMALDHIKLMQRPKILELGAGRCGQANRLTAEGGQVIAVDVEDFAQYASPNVSFVNADIIEYLDDFKSSRFGGLDVVFSQRTIHYFPYSDALAIFEDVFDILNAGGIFFLSASGASSELSEGYPVDSPLDARFRLLSESMQVKHGISQPVCLWSTEELSDALKAIGFSINFAQQSDFGNVKIAVKK